MKDAIVDILKLIWRRLPYIAIYTLTITAFLFLAEFAYYRYTDGIQFLNYTKFHFNTAEEHRDVPFEACKDTDYAYKVVGNRTIYRIPEGKGEIDKQIVGNYPLDSIISKEPCVSAFITQAQYDFTPGNYQVYTTFNFDVKYGNRKSVTFKSNIFQVIPSRPSTVDEIQAKIDALQKEIDLLKLQLQQARAGGMITEQVVSTAGGVTTTTTTQQRGADTPTPEASEQPTTPEPDNAGIIIDLPLLPAINIPSPL